MTNTPAAARAVQGAGASLRQYPAQQWNGYDSDAGNDQHASQQDER